IRNNVLLLEIGRGWSQPDPQATPRYDWSLNAESRALDESLRTLKPALGNRVILFLFSAANISGLQFLATELPNHPEIKGVVPFHPIPTPFLDEPIQIPNDGLRLSQLGSGPIWCKLGKMSLFSNTQRKRQNELIGNNLSASEDYLSGYLKPWQEPNGFS